MAFKLFSDVRETSTAPGTGSFGLNGAFDGTYFAFSAKYANGDTGHYYAKGIAGREIGKFTFNDLGGGSYSLSRSVIKSTNADAAVDFSSGNVDIAATNIAPSDLSAAQLAELTTAFGAISFAAAQSLSSSQKTQAQQNLGIREVLSASRTYYVRTDGNDSNTGLANTSGAAFATIQKAIDVAASLDLSIYTVTIQVGAGTYTAANTLKSYVGTGPIIIVGDETTPSNVVIQTTVANGFTADSVRGLYEIRGIKFTTVTAGTAFSVVNSNIKFQNLDFGTMSGASSAIICRTNAVMITTGNFTISGNMYSLLDLQQDGKFLFGGATTVTLTGTPAFSGAFITAKQASVSQISGVTFSGAATGQRYSVNSNAVVDTAGGGASYLPGNSAGSVGTGGVYA